MSSYLSIENLTVSYDDEDPVISELSIQIDKQGKVLALLGPSGAGKSSILKALVGTAPVRSGSIHLDGKDISKDPLNQRSVGMVFQDYSLFPLLTVFENIAFPLKAKKRKGWNFFKHFFAKEDAAIKQQVDQVLEMVQLSHLKDQFPSKLSGGEQQRVAIARAIIAKPKILCMDEPLAALDKQLKLDLLEEIHQLQRQLGLTLLYVTHDQEQAFRIADYIAILRKGKVEQLGTPQHLYECPANQFVASFMGGCNFFSIQSVLKEKESSYCLTTNRGLSLYTNQTIDNRKQLLAIRPEVLFFSSSPTPHSIKASVRSRKYLNGRMVFDVLAESGDNIQLYLPSNSDTIPEIDEGVFVSYKPDDWMVINQ